MYGQVKRVAFDVCVLMSVVCDKKEERRKRWMSWENRQSTSGLTNANDQCSSDTNGSGSGREREGEKEKDEAQW